MERLINIQLELNAPKNQYNSFGRYKYRSLEDIFTGLKPLIEKYKCAVLLSDDLELIGDRYFVKATARLVANDGNIIAENTAYAREALAKKGMDEAQITGSASSYARKYALSGLFAIDDVKDIDGKDNKKTEVKKPLTLSAYLKSKGVKDAKGFTLQYKIKNKEDAEKLLADLGSLDALIEEFKKAGVPRLP